MPVTIDGSNTPTAGGIGYGDGTELAFTTAGSSGQALLSAGAGVPTWGTPTASTATTATNLAGGFAGGVPYQSAPGTTAILAAGSSGQLLQTNGAGAPSWVTVATPTSGLTLVQTVTASGSTAVVNGFSSTYDNYILIISDVYPAADGRNFEFKFYITGTLISANYQYAYANVNSSSANSNIGSASNATIRLANSMDQSTVWNRSNQYVIYFFAVNGSSTYKSVIYDGTYHFNDVTYSIRGAGTQTATAGVLTGAEFSFPGSSFGGGTLQLYGFAKA
jgi:hypothetical protein